MIRHIVFFKFGPSATKEDKLLLIDQLGALGSKIESIRQIEVAKDIGGKSNSFDLVLNTVFDSMEDVEKYAIHPKHIKVLDLVKKVCESTVKIDHQTGEGETNRT